jgi:nucleotide-binding universal stress UspA family protein
MGSKYVVAAQAASRSLDTTERVGFKSILVATDFSNAAEKGLCYAIEIARRNSATLHVVHILSPAVYPYAPTSAWPDLAEQDRVSREESKAKLEEQLQAVRHELIFQGGDVYATLNELARDKQADLIVLGTHGRSGLEKVVLGSVAEKIFRETRFPVMTVGPKVGEKFRTTADLSRILYATDFSAESLHAAPFAISLAREHRANLILLNCFEGGEDGIQAMLQGLRQLVPFGTELRCEPICIVERGPHGQKILDVAEGHGADLIVLGVDGASKGLAHNTRFHGSALYKIVTQATCPVLTVRA